MDNLDKTCYKYKINEHVIYRDNGICRITDIRSEDFGGTGEKMYYVLNYLYDEYSVVYVPTDAPNIEDNIRPTLSEEEINSIISASSDTNYKWIDDSKARALGFEQILRSGDRAGIIWIIKVLSEHKLESAKNKRKLYVSDAKILAAAEKVIVEEFSFVLKVSKSEIVPYILGQSHSLR